jgi:hypothetical protein
MATGTIKRSPDNLHSLPIDADITIDLTGIVVAAAIVGPLPAGNNNIGDVDIASIPATIIAGMATLPAGVNNIGDVDVASIAAGETHIGEIGGHIDTVQVEFTRENNATPYSIGDIISSSAGAPVVLEMPLAFRVIAGSAYIVGCRITFNVKSVTPRLRIHLFNASTPTVAGDNLQHKELYADAAKRLGFFEMDAMVTAPDAAGSDMSRSLKMDLRVPVAAAAATRSLWILIETLDAVTLTALSKVNVTLSLDVN